MIVILFLFPVLGIHAQNDQEVVASEPQEDTLWGSFLRPVEITSDNEYLRKYRSAKYFIRRVYAYSELASAMLTEYQDTLETMSSKSKKKKFLKQANKELKDEFGDEIRNMSVTRGKYLNKLIYRETGLSTYDIIKDYRGGVKAAFYQSVCLLNGQNLKATFDPDEDAIIERVVQEIESGEVSIVPRPAKSDKGKEIEKRNKKKNKKKKKNSKSAVARN